MLEILCGDFRRSIKNRQFFKDKSVLQIEGSAEISTRQFDPFNWDKNI